MTIASKPMQLSSYTIIKTFLILISGLILIGTVLFGYISILNGMASPDGYRFLDWVGLAPFSFILTSLGLFVLSLFRSNPQ